MARDLGISHPVISRVVAGKQEPPGQLLLALSRWPKINLRWLFLGEGEPVSDRDLGIGGGRFCPVAQRLLPGDPGRYPEWLSETSLPVAEAYYTETAYWFCVSGNCPIVHVPDERIKAGDYLLMETSSAWISRVERMYKYLIALRDQGEAESGIVLGRLGWGEHDFFEAPDQFDLRVYKACGPPEETQLLGPQAIVPPAGSPPESGGKGRTGRRKSPLGYRQDAVVGVCVHVQRPGRN